MESDKTAARPQTPAEPDVAQPPRPLPRRIRLYIIFTVLVSGCLMAAVIALELRHGNEGTNWLFFGIALALLCFAEIATRRSLRLGEHGSHITPTWGLSFALLLLGAPTSAILATASIMIAVQTLDRRGVWRVVFNGAQVALCLALGTLVLFAFDIHGPLITSSGLSTSAWFAMIISAVTIFVSNVLLVCYPVSVVEQMSYVDTAKAFTRLSVSTDAAMFFLAPILVASIQTSVLLIPWLLAATLLMFRTAQQAFVSGHEADHDALTQLLNRRAFVAEVDNAVGNAGSETGAVVILDLDRFKDINDRLGHETGDHVLQAFSNRLTESLPPKTTAARFGGDEFAVLMQPLSRHDALDAVRLLHEAVGQPLMVDGFPLTTGISMGVALFPDHGSTTDSLLHAADVAMYRAKKLRSNVELFEPAGTTGDHGRMGLLADLTSAIDNEEFRICYQPQVSMATGAIVSIEALIRWEHPRLGRISPDDFISLAEQTDLIDPITNLVIKRSVSEVATIDSDVALAVNVSARNMQDRHFARDILELLDVEGFDPRRFEIELTESSIAQDPERTNAAFGVLRDAGVRVSVDDFGTGYSSFATLRDLSVDRLKIDRSLVMQLSESSRDRRIVQSIVDLAHALGSEVVAEGVETEAVWAHLDHLGCDFVQGYLVSRPLPLTQINDLICARATLGFPVWSPAVAPSVKVARSPS